MAENKPRRPPVKPKKIDQQVWISCRAKRSCEGNQAKIVFRQKTGGGGSITRYRCLTCNGSWHIQL